MFLHSRGTIGIVFSEKSKSRFSPAQNQFDLELWYKVFFFTDSCSLDIAINDSG